MFQSLGGAELAPDATLSPPTLATPQPPTDGTGPADLDPGLLRPLGVGGPTPEFSPGDLLGRGGMGEVHVAVDHGLRREVALKSVGSTPRDHTAQALVHEALFTGYLEHPNVVPVHRLGRDEGGRPAFVMKRVSGTSWSDLLADPDHPTWATLPHDRLRANLEILGDVCNAVHFAHSRGVLHRDIKPSNVMVGEFGEVYLLDWGLALRLDRLASAPEGIVGTLAYMAPEMLEAPTQLSPATDVYLLGASLHCVLTGSPRHSGASHHPILLEAFASRPVEYPADVPRELATLCNQATARDPAHRPASALAFRQALERFLEHRGSIRLAEQARERLRSLERADGEGRRAATLFSECRFGFEQALAVWPENAEARAGLQRCLELTIERALAEQNPGRAEPLLATLPEPRPDLEARLAALKAAAAEAPARLQELEQDLDPRVGSRQRAVIVALLALLGYAPVLAVPYLVLQAKTLVLSYRLVAGFGFLIGALLLFHLAAGRRWLLGNRANRRLVAMAAAGWLGAMLNVVACWAYEIPMGILIMNMGIVLTLVGMMVAVVVDARLWIAVGIGALGLFSGLLDPAPDPLYVHVGVGLLVFGLIAWMWYRDPPGHGQELGSSESSA